MFKARKNNKRCFAACTPDEVKSGMCGCFNNVKNSTKMTLEEFKIKSKRTCPSLGGGFKMDLAHMVLGMNSELSELEAAENNNDTVNVGEETADFLWYLCNLETFVEKEDSYPLDSGDDTEIHRLISRTDDGSVSVYTLMSEFQDFIKKHIAYDKEIDALKFCAYLGAFKVIMLDILEDYGLELSDILKSNVAKLWERFPEGFDQDKAINRDHDKERIILENGSSI